MRILFFFLLMTLKISAQTTFEQAEIYFKKEQFQKAKPLFIEHLTNNPNDLKAKEYLGDIAGKEKDWDTAIEFYKDLLETDTKSANYNFKYGGALGMKALEVNRLKALTYVGDIKRHFEAAAQLDPNHIQARWGLVEYYMLLPGIIGGSEKKALEYADQLSKISPVDGFLSKGKIAELSKRFTDAEENYKQAIKVGGSAHTYNKLFVLYEQNNMPKEAIAVALKSLEIHKINAINYQIGKLVADYKVETTTGIRCLQNYIDNYTSKDSISKDWAYFRLAQIHKNNSQKQEAINWIDKALAIRPSFKEAKKEKELIQAL